MDTLVVVANQTLGTPALGDAIERSRTADGPLIHLVVPVAGVGGMGELCPARVGGFTQVGLDVSAGHKVAEQRLANGLDWLGGLGYTACGELVTEHDACAAVATCVAGLDACGVVVSTLPRTLSRWLHHDLPHRIERKVSVPVTVVTPPNGH